MAWILAPTLPGIPSNWSWEGLVPDLGLPAPPPPPGVDLGGLTGVPAPSLTGVPGPSLTGVPIILAGGGGGGGGLSNGGQAAPGSSDLALVLLLGLGAYAVSKVKGLRL